MDQDFVSRLSTKYTNPKAPRHHEFLSRLDSIYQELAAYAKTKRTVGGNTRETDPIILRVYLKGKPSSHNWTDETSGDDEGPAKKRAQTSDISSFDESRDAPGYFLPFFLLLVDHEQVNLSSHQA